MDQRPSKLFKKKLKQFNNSPVNPPKTEQKTNQKSIKSTRTTHMSI
jgi:hypothetical protein